MVNCIESPPSYQSMRKRADVDRSEPCSVQHGLSVSLSLKRPPSSRDGKFSCLQRSHRNQISTRPEGPEGRRASETCPPRVTHCLARDPSPTRRRRSDPSGHPPQILRARSFCNARGETRISASPRHSLKRAFSCNEKKSCALREKRTEAHQEKRIPQSESPNNLDRELSLLSSRSNIDSRGCSREAKGSRNTADCFRSADSSSKSFGHTSRQPRRGIDPPPSRLLLACEYEYDSSASEREELEKKSAKKPNAQVNAERRLPKRESSDSMIHSLAPKYPFAALRQGMKGHTRSISLDECMLSTNPGERCATPKQSQRKARKGRQFGAAPPRLLSGHADKRAKPPISTTLNTSSILPLSPVSTNSCRLRSPQNTLAIRFQATPVKRTVSLGSYNLKKAHAFVTDSKDPQSERKHLQRKSFSCIENPSSNLGVDSPHDEKRVSMHFSQRTCVFQEVRRSQSLLSVHRRECVRPNKRIMGP